MVVLALLLLGAAILGGWFLLVALVGRSSFPRRERLPLRAWRFAAPTGQRGPRPRRAGQHRRRPAPFRPASPLSEVA